MGAAPPNDLLFQMIQNVALMGALVLVYARLRDRIDGRPPFETQLILGYAFAAVALAVTLFPIEPVRGVAVDGRALVLALAAPFAGPAAGLAAGGLAASSSLIIGGFGAESDALAAVMASGLGVLVWAWFRQNGRTRPAAPHLALCGFFAAGATIFSYAFIPSWPVAKHVLAVATPAVLPSMILGALLIGAVLLHEDRRRELETQVRDDEARFRDVAALSSDWIWSCDARGRLTYLSHDPARGDDPTRRIPMRTVGGMLGGLDDPEAADAFFRWLSQAAPVRHALHEGGFGREGRWISTSAKALRAPDGRFIGLRGASRDVTEETLAREELKRLADSDAMTGLANRRRFFELGAAAFARARRHRRHLAVAMVDADRFKRINDDLGHAAGDAALKALAQRVAETCRVEDLPARLGGEEFAVLLNETDLDGAVAFAERLRRAVSAAGYRHADVDRTLTVSIGVAEMGPGDPDLDSLIARADRALYAAKTGGRDRTASDPGHALPAAAE